METRSHWPDAPDPNTLAAPESFPFEDVDGDMVVNQTSFKRDI